MIERKAVMIIFRHAESKSSIYSGLAQLYFSRLIWILSGPDSHLFHRFSIKQNFFRYSKALGFIRISNAVCKLNVVVVSPVLIFPVFARGEVLTWVACTLLFSSKLENSQAKLLNSRQFTLSTELLHCIILLSALSNQLIAFQNLKCFLESEIALLRLLFSMVLMA